MKTVLIPFKSITFKSKFTNSKITELLQDKIGVFKNFSFKNTERNTDKLFYGKITSNRKFEIYQIIKGRNSFIPIVKGTVNSYETESVIEIKMRFHVIVILIIIFFIGFLTIGNIIDYLKSGVVENLLIGISMSFFIYSFAVYEFNKQTENVTEILKTILDAEITEH